MCCKCFTQTSFLQICRACTLCIVLLPLQKGVLWLCICSHSATCPSLTTHLTVQTYCSYHSLKCSTEQNWCPCSCTPVTSKSPSTHWLRFCKGSQLWCRIWEPSKFSSIKGLAALDSLLSVEWIFAGFLGVLQLLQKRKFLHPTYSFHIPFQRLVQFLCSKAQHSSAQLPSSTFTTILHSFQFNDGTGTVPGTSIRGWFFLGGAMPFSGPAGFCVTLTFVPMPHGRRTSLAPASTVLRPLYTYQISACKPESPLICQLQLWTLLHVLLRFHHL